MSKIFENCHSEVLLLLHGLREILRLLGLREILIAPLIVLLERTHPRAGHAGNERHGRGGDGDVEAPAEVQLVV